MGPHNSTCMGLREHDHGHINIINNITSGSWLQTSGVRLCKVM